MPGRGDDLRLGLALEQRPVVLRGDERRVAAAGREVRGVGQLPAGEVRVADVPDLALGDQLVQRGDGLLDRGHRVRDVLLVQVDVVGAQPAQRLGDRTPDVGAAALGAGRRPVPHVHALATELRGQHDLVTARAEDLAQGALGSSAPAICVRGVEQGDPGVDGRVHHRARPVHVEAAAEVVAAEPDDRHQQSRLSQGPIAHPHILRTSAARPPAQGLPGAARSSPLTGASTSSRRPTSARTVASS